LPFSFFSLQARWPAFLILTLCLGSWRGVSVPEATVVAKRFTLVEAAKCREVPTVCILLEAFCEVLDMHEICSDREEGPEHADKTKQRQNSL